jgi:hypothetical protein
MGKAEPSCGQSRRIGVKNPAGLTDRRSLPDIRPSLPKNVELRPPAHFVRQIAVFTGRIQAGARNLWVIPRRFFPFVTESDDGVGRPRDLLL